MLRRCVSERLQLLETLPLNGLARDSKYFGDVELVYMADKFQFYFKYMILLKFTIS